MAVVLSSTNPSTLGLSSGNTLSVFEGYGEHVRASLLLPFLHHSHPPPPLGDDRAVVVSYPLRHMTVRGSVGVLCVAVPTENSILVFATNLPTLRYRCLPPAPCDHATATVNHRCLNTTCPRSCLHAHLHTQYEDADTSPWNHQQRVIKKDSCLVANQQNTLPRRLIRGYSGHNRALGVLTFPQRGLRLIKFKFFSLQLSLRHLSPLQGAARLWRPTCSNLYNVKPVRAISSNIWS